jgi:hypothetical protein
MDKQQYKHFRQTVKGKVLAIEPRITRAVLAEKLGINSLSTVGMALNGNRVSRRYRHIVFEISKLLERNKL